MILHAKRYLETLQTFMNMYCTLRMIRKNAASEIEQRLLVLVCVLSRLSAELYPWIEFILLPL